MAGESNFFAITCLTDFNKMTHTHNHIFYAKVRRTVSAFKIVC